MLTIVSGKYKSRKLVCPKTGTRPTSSLVKKSLFDTLRPQLQEAIFCDLFAGSGAIGLEALSQGASHVYLIEAHKKAFQTVLANIDTLKCQNDCTAFLKTAHKFLQTADLSAIDIFFLDPPYDILPSDPSSYESLLTFFDQTPLKPTCQIICETSCSSRIKQILPTLPNLTLISSKSYGDSLLYFIEKR